MKILSLVMITFLALHAFWCDFGEDELTAFLVELPEGVKDVNLYGRNLCQFAADWREVNGDPIPRKPRK
jgi:hypothetical protein